MSITLPFLITADGKVLRNCCTVSCGPNNGHNNHLNGELITSVSANKFTTTINLSYLPGRLDSVLRACLLRDGCVVLSAGLAARGDALVPLASLFPSPANTAWRRSSNATVLLSVT
jgi:hypothetical protein